MTRQSGQLLVRNSLGSIVAAALLGLAVPGCLVTSNSDLPAPNDIPQIKRIAPPVSFSQVKSIGDPGCTSGPATNFQVDIRYQDTQTDNLFLQLYVNGRGTGAMQLTHTGTEKRTPQNELCVLDSALTKPCNHVLVAVSTQLDKLQASGLPDLLDFDINYTEWNLLPSVVVEPNRDPNACNGQSAADGEQ